MLAAVDEAIGQIVTALENSGQRENTLIIFSSDNGGPKPGINTPLRGFKGSTLEGGVRACAFANWPGHIPAAVTIKEPMHMIDWYPTLVKLANGKLEQKLPIDGRDVWPMLTKGEKSPHDAILCVQAPTHAALRMGDWKLQMNSSADDSEESEEATPKKKAKAKAQPNTIELYNLAIDIGEKTNLANQEPERVATMRAKLTEMLKDAVQPGHVGKEVVAPK
jgi:arylsulfatase A-like enzyme